MSSFLDLAGDEAPPKSFLDLAGPTPKAKPKKAASVDAPSADVAGGTYLQQSPATQAAIMADVRKTGAQDFTVNGARPEAAAPASPVVAQPAQPRGPTDANGIPVAPGANTTPTASPDVPWWQKGYAGFQAAANTAAGVAGAVTGGTYGTLEALGENISSLASGKKPQLSVETNAINRARQFTPELPKAMQTPLGQEYTGDVGDFMQRHGGSAIAIGPEISALGGILKSGARYDAAMVGGAADRSMEGMRAAFEAKKAGARVEPTMSGAPVDTGPAGPAAVKPRYKIVNGQITPVDAPAPSPPGEPAPRPAYVPKLEDTSPEFQAAIKKVGADPHNNDVVGRHIEAETLPIPIRLTKGQATQDPSQLSNEQNMRGSQKELADHFNLQGKQLVQNVEAIRDAAAPDVKGANHVENGQSLIDSYKTIDQATRADISAKYKALADANGGSLPVNGQDFVASADAALKRQMKGRYVPASVAGDLEQFRNGGPMTFEDFENMRTNLAAEGRKAARGGDGNAEGAINLVRTALEDLPISGETAAVKPLADAARSAARARFDTIKADPAYKAAINDASPIGEQSSAADNFINNFVVKGKVANVARMKQTLANDPVANQTIAAGTINYLKKQAGADPLTGNFSQAGYNRALSEIEPKIDALFDAKTAQQIKALGNVAKYTQAQPRGSYVNNSNTFVAAAADKAATGLEKAGNLAVPGLGLGTDVRSALARRAVRKGVEDVLRPGAGVTRLSDLGKP